MTCSKASTIKVVDSETTSRLFLSNAMENMALRRTIQNLDITQKTVIHRISSNQKVVYRQFQKKIKQSEIERARLKGDKAMETELRQRKVKCNTTLADDDEVNEVLKRIWRQGDAKIKRRRADLANSTKRSKSAWSIRTNVTSTYPPDSNVKSRPSTNQTTHGPPFFSGSNGSQAPKIVVTQTRPATTGANVRFHPSPLPSEAGDESGELIRSASMMSLEGNGQYISTGVDKGGRAGHMQRPKTAPVFKSLRRKTSMLAASPASRPKSSLSAAAILSGGDPWEAAREKLLNSHHSRIKCAHYGVRIQEFCDSIEPFTQDKERFIRDYYFTRLNPGHHSFSNSSGADSNYTRYSIAGESEMRRAMGNPKIRSLTFKLLNQDYSAELSSLNGSVESESLSSSEESEVDD